MQILSRHFGRYLKWYLCFLMAAGMMQAALAQNQGEYATPMDMKVQRALSVIKTVKDENRIKGSIANEDIQDLPVGIVREISGNQYIIVIDSARVTPQGGFFSAYASVTIPGTEKQLVFAGKDIKFHPGGIAASVSTRLELLTDFHIPVSDMVSLDIPADGSNYLEWDCNGFKSVNLKGNFVFSKDMLQPLNGMGNVTASFAVNLTDLHNFLVDVNITPFRMTNLKDLSFEVKHAVVDMSDLKNPDAFTFPRDYNAAFGGDVRLWRGFYLQELMVFLPPELSTRNGPATIKAANVLIDDAGVSGLFAGDNLFDMNMGSADGWSFSINHIEVQLLRNRLVGGGFNGDIRVPFLGSDSLAYSARMSQNGDETDYLFALATNTDKEYQTPFGGTLLLAKGSTIQLEKSNGKLIPSAILHGKLTISQNVLKVKNIEFQDLTLSTARPYLHKGYFAVNTEEQNTASGFPLSINEISLGIYEGKATLGMHVWLNLMGKEDKGFSADAKVFVSAKVEETYEGAQFKKQSWKLDGVRFGDISLATNIGPFSLNGTLGIYRDDPVYGNGIHGSLQLQMSAVITKKIKVQAYFGTKDTYRYWHADANLPILIPVCGVVNIQGILGGVSYHMKRPDRIVFDNNGDVAVDVNPQERIDDLKYVPDEKVGMGFLAGVTLVAVSKKLITADVMLEFVFNSREHGGGINSINFDGYGYLFSDVAKYKVGANGQRGGAPVTCNFKMSYQRDINTFYSSLTVYMNLAGVLKGTGPDGRIGTMAMLFSPDQWYVKVGTPSQPLGVSVLNIVKAQTYFIAGNKLTDMIPDPPEAVREILGQIQPTDFRRNGTIMVRGAGIGFGLSLEASTKGEPLIFYYAFGVGAGTNMMLLNMKDAHCEGSNGPIGMDGWYAMGDAYAFLYGRVGIKIRSRRFDILSLGAAALLQANLPNPSWFRGTIAARYKLLGGLIKGKMHFQFDVGQQCQLVGTKEMGDIEAISAIQPDNGGQEVNVFSSPQVAFNLPVNKEIVLTENAEKPEFYRIMLDEFLLTRNGQSIPGAISWNEGLDVAMLKTPDVLPEFSDLKVTVKVHWEKRTPNTAWERLSGGGNIEVKEAVFKTGPEPDSIPAENIVYSYPLDRQYNFYKNEYGNGYIKLNYGQPKVFRKTDDGMKLKFAARFIGPDKQPLEVPFAYDEANTTVNFQIPEKLKNESIYQLALMRTPEGGSNDANLKREQQTTQLSDDGADISVRRNTLTGTVAASAEKEVLSQFFRTSMYNTFAEKLTSIGQLRSLFDIAIGYTGILGGESAPMEALDRFETAGNIEGTVKKLVAAEALPDNPWFSNEVYPLLYQHYPLESGLTLDRSGANKELQLPPLNGITVDNKDAWEGQYLNDNEIRAGFAAKRTDRLLVQYKVSFYANADFFDLRQKIAAKYETRLGNGQGYTLSPGVQQIFYAKGVPALRAGNYRVRLKYTLPGINKVTTSKDFTLTL
ncbi:hypothetical protein ECE50_001750 [Chitinophaga sp. Mgbs1]|uniref:Uncharacterized protein n=1 Tax=Chitinophaga solisilvae TaxID=1233460 RepID=A0A433WM11_9BACT|nr:hypothetical protein [Chitinophaga solisilvae]